MHTKLEDKAAKSINRFKYLSPYDVEDIVLEHSQDEKFQEFLDECESDTYDNIYDKDNDITIFTQIEKDSDIIKILDVKRGDKRFVVDMFDMYI